jgi:RsiW-degrading membrane proteinase PrsW (M82 family)
MYVQETMIYIITIIIIIIIVIIIYYFYYPVNHAPEFGMIALVCFGGLGFA